jgi:hypothetical protein
LEQRVHTTAEKALVRRTIAETGPDWALIKDDFSVTNRVGSGRLLHLDADLFIRFDRLHIDRYPKRMSTPA